MVSLASVGLAWHGVPLHSIARTGVILVCSEHTVKKLLDEGELSAVTFPSRTPLKIAVTTASIVAYLAKAEPWESPGARQRRIEAARAARPKLEPYDQGEV